MFKANFLIGVLSIVALGLGIFAGRYIVVSGQADLAGLVAMESKIVLTVVAVCTVVLGYMSYRKWQPEAVGKRKLELAEAILSDVYRFQRLIARARMTKLVVKGTDILAPSDRVPAGRETSQQRNILDKAHAVELELDANAEFVKDFLERVDVSRAYFGDGIVACFQKVDLIETHLRNTISGVRRDGFFDDWDTPDGMAAQVRKKIEIAVLADLGMFDEDGDAVGRQVVVTVEAFEAILGKSLLRESAEGPENRQIGPSGDPLPDRTT